MTNKTTTKYSPEVRERTVRIVFERQGSTPRSGRRSARSRRRSAARRRSCETRTISVMKGVYPSHGTSSARVREAMHLIKAARSRFRPILLTLDQAAIPELQRAADLSPDEASFHLSLARSLEEVGRVADAAREYETYLEKAPSAPDAESLRAHLKTLPSPRKRPTPP